MEKIIRVKIEGGKNIGISDNVFTWSEDDDAEAIFIGATNFAEGFATALMAQGYRLGYPLVKPIDGYHWFNGEFRIKVVNKDDKIVRTPEDV